MRPSAVALTLLSGCHLAADPPAATCDPGSHLSDGACSPDAPTGPLVTIEPATDTGPCAISPESITVPSTGQFSFRNLDTVEHAVRGADGAVWVSVKPRLDSSFVGITRAGTWGYAVSGCPKGGAVVVVP
jgi:hypothetical protein